MNSDGNIQYKDDFIPERWWEGLLLLSGASASLYFICWKHLFFFDLGKGAINETVVLSTFLFGLSMGALLGGELSHRFPGQLPKVFVVLQAVLAVLGLASYPLLRALAPALAPASQSALPFLVGFAVLLPTLALGALLPVCLRYVHQRKGDVGQVLSGFFGAKLLGGGVAALVLVPLLFLLTNLMVALWVAAALNGGAAFTIHRLQQGKSVFGRAR